MLNTKNWQTIHEYAIRANGIIYQQVIMFLTNKRRTNNEDSLQKNKEKLFKIGSHEISKDGWVIRIKIWCKNLKFS